MERGEVEDAGSSFERPLECGECKRQIAYLYTEIVGKTKTSYAMCVECPILKQKLSCQSSIEGEVGQHTKLCCGGCGVSLEDIRKGSLLGCALCYEVFKEEIVNGLIELCVLPPSFLKGEITNLHRGKIAGADRSSSIALKLSHLQQALHDTLNREDYEQAAYLRDQIKALEGHSDKQEGGT